MVARSLATARISNTLFRNMNLAVELVDVTGGGTVTFEATTLANVVLHNNKVVSTSLNDFDPVWSFDCTDTDWEYNPDMDDAYDVRWQPVARDAGGVYGAEFFIANSTMSDCLFLLTADGLVLPGCPPESAEARRPMFSDCMSKQSNPKFDDFFKHSSYYSIGLDRPRGSTREKPCDKRARPGNVTSPCAAKMLASDDPWFFQIQQVWLPPARARVIAAAALRLDQIRRCGSEHTPVASPSCPKLIELLGC